MRPDILQTIDDPTREPDEPSAPDYKAMYEAAAARVAELEGTVASPRIPPDLESWLGLTEGDPDYRPLIAETIETLRQATAGKGRDRHARGRDYLDQPINVIPSLLGEAGIGFLIGRAMKKSEEALGLPHDRKVTGSR